MTEDIFIKILNNSATEAEKNDFFKALAEDNTRREEFFRYKNIYAVSNFERNKYEKLQKERFELFWRSLKQVSMRKISHLWYHYAAIFIVALLLGTLIHSAFNSQQKITFYSQQIAYSSEKGSVSTIHLEDGSTIWLSSGSKIVIHKSADGIMTAQLNGEAYFDMIPDTTRKFTIDLGSIKVKDIGTQFNIRAYSFEDRIYTTLLKGQIDLISSKDQIVYSVKPYEYVQYDRLTEKISVTQQDPSIATAWKDGKFVFIDKTLSEICCELENWYNVEIIIGNQSLANTKYTSVIKRTTTVSLVLKMLSLTDNIKYKINNRKEARDIVTIY